MKTPRPTFLRRVFGPLVANPHYKLGALTLAIGAWLYVQGEQIVDAKVKARVGWELPADLLTTEPLPAAVTLAVVGPRNATRKAARADILIPIDLTETGIGEHGLDFSTMEVQGLPPNVKIESIAPSSIRFVLDEVQLRKVRIEPKMIGEPGEGYSIEYIVVEPPVVTLRGPRAATEDLIDVATLPIDVSGIDRDLEQRVELDLPRAVKLESDDPIRVLVDVEPRVVTKAFEDTPVMVWQHPGWSVEPSTVKVTIEGPAAAMSTIGSSQVVVFAHLPETTDRIEYEAPFGPVEGLRLEVVHMAGSEAAAIAVEPSVVRLVRQ